MGKQRGFQYGQLAGRMRLLLLVAAVLASCSIDLPLSTGLPAAFFSWRLVDLWSIVSFRGVLASFSHLLLCCFSCMDLGASNAEHGSLRAA